MKKVLLMLLLLGSFAFSAEIPDSLLTESQRQLVNSHATQENVRGWIGIGNEVGTAVDASLKAVTERSNEFAHTSVGKLTIALVVWKVMGNTISNLLIAIVSTIVFFIWFIYLAYRIHKEEDRDWKSGWAITLVISFVLYLLIVLIAIGSMGS